METPIARDTLAQRLANLPPEKRKLLMRRLSHSGAASTDSQRIPRRPDSTPIPLSFAQERLWFLDQLETDSTAYNLSNVLRLKGPLNVPALQYSLQELVRRHETLRTTFPASGGSPVQCIVPELSLPLSVHSLDTLPAEARETEARLYARKEARRPFDLARGPLLRTSLLRLAEEEHWLVLVIHHIIADAWSLGILRQELATVYTAFCTGRAVALPELPIQYADYAVWQRQRLQGEVLEQQLTYWKEQLAGAPPVVDLPPDRPRPAVQTYQGAQHSFHVSKPLRDALQALSQQEGVTLFMLLLAAFQTLLSRYTGQTDLSVGTPIAGRTQTEVEGLIGFFVNTLVMRVDLIGNPSFREILRRVRKVALGAYAHQEVLFEKLVAELQPERHLSYPPLFQVMFALQNVPTAPLDMPKLVVEQEALDNGTAMFDLTLFIFPQEAGLWTILEYNSDLFDAATMGRLAQHFQMLLEGIAANPEQRLSDLSLLSAAERQQLLVEWNATQAEYPQQACLHELFEAQAERTPAAVAVVSEDQHLTYQELNRRANQLAYHLRKLGVEAEVPVGICVERSLEMVVGLLGILKAGGAYVPLDPTYPRERLTFMLDDAQVTVLLTQAHLSEELPASGAQVVYLDTDWETVARESEENPVNEIAALAYVLYTSGSTGMPKGVLGLHRGAVNRLHWMWKFSPFETAERCCQKTSLNFVDAVWEVFGPLLQGIPTVLIPEEVLKDPHRLIPTLADEHITRLVLVPSLLRAILDTPFDLHNQLSGLKYWVSSGEALSTELSQRFQERLPQGVLLNLYGSSEVSADVTWHDTREGRSLPGVPIGRPMANTQVYVLDRYLQPVPVGVHGDLYVGGAGLARGYLHRPELTAERFVSDPFSNEPGARLYKTGDLARYLPDGTIEYLGRIDTQVKVRGFRIELGEIEALLGHHGAVQEAVVVVREDQPDDPRLVAYVIPRQGQIPTNGELRSFLKQQLPDYMIPSAFLLLDALPLTPNGKVDRRALPAPEHVQLQSEETRVVPRDPLELQLTEIWEAVLGCQSISVRDNFFELGGHSLLAVRLFAQIKTKLGKELPLATLFQAPTIEQLADILRQEEWVPRWASLVAIQPSGSKPPLFLVHAGEGNVLFYRDLARHLGPEQPVYGLQLQGLGGGSEQKFHDRVEDMAVHYVSELRTVQAEGPYLIGGRCFGSIVALEMAQQLRAQGQAVALLALIDPIVPPGLKSFQYRLRYCMKNLQHNPRALISHVLGLSQRWGMRKLKKGTGHLLRHLSRLYPAAIFEKLSVEMLRTLPQMSVGRKALSQARRNYIPRTYPERMTFFVDPERAALVPYPWTELAAGGLEWVQVPGHQDAMFQEPQVQILAEQLRKCAEETGENRRLDRTNTP